MKNNDDVMRDIKSSIAVALVALPLCLGIALASGAPLNAGILAGIIGGIITGLISNSHVSVSGPAAGLTTIVSAAILEHGTFAKFLACLVIAGLLQIGMGLLKKASLTQKVPHSVIQGMLCAIGVIIIMKQIPVAMGTTAGGGSAHNAPMILSFLGLLILIAVEFTGLKTSRLFQIIPVTLCVVLVCSIVALFMGSDAGTWAMLERHFVQIASPSSSGSLIDSLLLFPQWTDIQWGVTLKHAAIIAVVASLESLLCIEASEKMDPLRRPTSRDRELLAQGAGNLLCGLIGGIPVTSVIVRTTVNINAGAATKRSAIFHGIILLLGLLLFPWLLNKIPLAALAAILIFTGIKLINIPGMKPIFTKPIIHWLPFATTIVAIVATDLLTGIIIGLVVHAILVFGFKMKLEH